MSVGFLVELEARPDKVADLIALLERARDSVSREPGMQVWFAARTGENRFVSFNVFDDEVARDAHAAGELAAELGARADELLQTPPRIVAHGLLAQYVR